jgi:hypothetical protein
MGYLITIKIYRAIVWLDQPAYHIETGGFSGTVGAKQTNRLTALQLKRYITHHRTATITLAEFGRHQTGFFGYQCRAEIFYVAASGIIFPIMLTQIAIISSPGVTAAKKLANHVFNIV